MLEVSDCLESARPAKEEHRLGLAAGTALYVGALVGPGVLLVPALAVRAAGAASILALGGLLVLSALLAVTFAALGAQLPVAGGVTAYVRAGLGDTVAAATGGCFVAGTVVGLATVALIGGFYVADLTSSGATIAATVGLAIFFSVLATNALGLRVSSRLQLMLSSLLVTVIAVALAVALPERGGRHWRPFAPHGWSAIGTAAEFLVWLFFGWEAVAQLANRFASPERDLPRAAGLAWATTSLLYVGLGAAMIAVTTGANSKVPLADLVSVGFGRLGRETTAFLAVVLTVGTMNVYTAATANLIASLAQQQVLPSWLGRDTERGVPRAPLPFLAAAGAVVIVALIAGLGTDAVVRATAACWVAVYGLVLLSAIRILHRGARQAALAAFILIGVLGALSALFLVVPLVAGLTALGVRRRVGGSARS